MRGLTRNRVANWLVWTLALVPIGVCVPRLALAHFHLDAPPSWANQNATSGDPQKSAPCGETNVPNMTQAVATNIVTPFQPGQTITVTLTETVSHPGHYRVALAQDRSMLPADPPVTAGDTACGSTVIDSTPDFPVLVDGALLHTAALSGKQTIQVTLPTNITCTKCTLQVVEFMSNHGLNNPGGCFYHHCADISIMPGNGGASSTGGAGGAAGASSKGGAGGTAKGGAGGTAGSSGKGGAGGGGANNGGVTGAGGASATGGSVNTGGASGGSATGGTTTGGTLSTTGGTASNTGGVSTGGTTTGGTALTGGSSTGGSSGGSTTAGTSGAPAEDAGCGCSLPGQARSSLAGVAAIAALGALLRRRRRR